MKKLTERQVVGLLNLVNHPSVDHTDISCHQHGSIYASVASTLNSSLDDIESELYKLFPSMLLKGDPFKTIRDDGNLATLYDFNCDEEIKITVHMYSSQREKDSAPTEPHIVENIQSDYIESEAQAQ